MSECLGYAPLHVDAAADARPLDNYPQRMLDRLLSAPAPAATAPCPPTPPPAIVLQPGPFDFYNQLLRPRNPADFVLNLLTLLALALALYALWTVWSCVQRQRRRPRAAGNYLK